MTSDKPTYCWECGQELARGPLPPPGNWEEYQQRKKVREQMAQIDASMYVPKSPSPDHLQYKGSETHSIIPFCVFLGFMIICNVVFILWVYTTYKSPCGG